MPGIFGYRSDRNLEEGPEILRSMGSLLSTRPGQRASALCGGWWGLGSTWIPGLQIDPEPAQEITLQEWSVAVGELFPGRDGEIRRPVSARPAILDALRAGRPEELRAANGAFAGARLDLPGRSLEVVCDRFGLQLIYYTQSRGVFAFASEMKALLALPWLDKALDPAGLARFLTLGEQFGATTLLAGVRAAPAGALLRARGGPAECTAWSEILFEANPAAGSPAEAAEQAGRLFKQAVARQTADGLAVGVPLSGGLDSRICLAAVPPEARPATSFTWGDRGCLDRRFAARIARRAGSVHRDLDYRYLDLPRLGPEGVWLTDGMAGSADFHVLPFLEELADHAQVILNGFAGDVILGGSLHRRALRGLKLEAAARVLFHKKNICIPVAEAAALLPGEVGREAGRLEGQYVAEARAHDRGDTFNALDSFYLDSRVRRWTSFGTQLLRARLISRAPFYDRDFFDLVASLPGAWRLDHKLYHRVLLSHFPEVAGVGWETTGLPASWPPGPARMAGSLLRRARGALERLGRGRPASPYPVARIDAVWRGALAPFLGGVLSDRGRALRQHVPAALVERTWSRFLAGEGRWTRCVGVLLALDWFLETVLAGPPRRPLRPEEVCLSQAGYAPQPR